MEKILVVEDDRATRKALKQLFEPEGYSVELAENGADGLANFRLSRPNLVILDLRLPQLRGQEVCRRWSSAGAAGRQHGFREARAPIL